MSDRSTVLPKFGRYLVFDYIYCDASNYKIFGSLLFSGTLSYAERNELIACLDGGEFFVAEQVGVPPLYSELFEEIGGPTDDDHAWHTFGGLREELELIETAKVSGEASGLLAVFRPAKQNWHPELSPNFCC